MRIFKKKKDTTNHNAVTFFVLMIVGMIGIAFFGQDGRVFTDEFVMFEDAAPTSAILFTIAMFFFLLNSLTGFRNIVFIACVIYLGYVYYVSYTYDHNVCKYIEVHNPSWSWMYADLCKQTK